MSIKLTRAAKVAKIGNYPSSFSAMAKFLPESVITKLSSREIADMIDEMWSLANNSKSIATDEAIENGGVYKNNYFYPLANKVAL